MIETEAVIAQGTLKAVCSRDELTRALGIVSRGVSTRTSVQILAGILIEADDDGKLQLAATDMELSLRTSLEAKVDSGGSVVVPGRLLLDLARLLPEAEVSLEHRLEEAVVEVRCGSASYRLHTYNAEDFPRLPDTQVEAHEVDRQTLLETVARVSRSASRDESRPVLTGVLVHFEPGKLVMAATDSYRLSVKETVLEGTVRELEAIVPARALGELARIAGEGDKIVLGVHENQVVFGTGDAWLTTRRIDGQFPNYKQIVPEAFEYEVPVGRDELLDVVRRASGMAQRNSPLRLRFGDGELAVSAPTP